jgi:hypothetical protein
VGNALTIAAFRGHEVVCALGLTDFILFLFLKELTHPEIPKFRLAGLGYQDVLRLYIPVDDVITVHYSM